MMDSSPSILGVAQSAISFDVPANACDCHVLLFGPADAYPYAPEYPYAPAVASVEDLLALQDALGLRRMVLVQPVAYGTDHSRLLAGLRQLNGRARGIAVIDATCPESELEALHAAGIRGARVDLVENRSGPAAAFDELLRVARRVAGFGWHIETDAGLAELTAFRDAVLALPVPLVVRHFARASAALGPDQPGFTGLLSLLRSGRVYVKLSAPRLAARQPDSADMAEIARALIWANPDRVLWGSDWPHPAIRRARSRNAEPVEAFEPEDDGRALNRLRDWAVEATLLRRILTRNPARLYRFGKHTAG